MSSAIFLVLALLFAPMERAAEADDPCVAGPLKDSRQLVLSIAAGWDSAEARVRRFDRRSSREAWRPVDSALAPASLGRKGLGWGLGLHPLQAAGPVKKEGDGRSPAGIFGLIEAFGYPDSKEVAARLPYTQVTRESRCVDDPKSRYYNRVVFDVTNVASDWASGVEELRRPDGQYEYAVVIGQNGAGRDHVVAGGGSCIFVHVWKDPGMATSGCTALAVDKMRALLHWLDPALEPRLVQLPESEYRRHAEDWCLPRVADPAKM
jgi:L,D-peptidoglycan transpeptidase YkuD (ErfK/YbiS/YcfS/YnhG family)